MSKVEKNEANMAKCACSKCPSYNSCAKGKMEGLYCAQMVGKSNCEFQTNGCICGSCPLHRENSLKSAYYCMQGSAEEVDGKVQ